MERIILHWTAGGHKANASDIEHYHVIVEGDGQIVHGKFAIEDNLSTSTPYAAHTGRLNTGSIGVAMAGMRGAKERPFSAGPSPLTGAQVAATVDQIASLCRQYNIPVTRQTVLSHAEVEPTLGVKQRGKWDVTWMPGMDVVGDAVAVGDVIRSRVKMAITGPQKPPTAPRAPIERPRPTKDTQSGLWAVIQRILRAIKGDG